MQKIYTVEQPKIHLSEVIGYGPENKIYIISNDIFFGNKEELIRFLARAHKQVVNWNGKPIRGEFRNEYMENQALNGFSRKSRYENVIDESLHVTEPNMDWKVNKFLFWLDTPEQPNIDVRIFKKEVDTAFLFIPKNISHIEWNYSIMTSIKSRQAEPIISVIHGAEIQNISIEHVLLMVWKLRKNIRNLSKPRIRNLKVYGLMKTLEDTTPPVGKITPETGIAISGRQERVEGLKK